MFRSNLLKMLQPALVNFRHQKRMKSTFYRGVHFLFKKNLLLTNSVTSGGFMALGDWVQQEIEIHAKLLPAFDWHRLSTYLIFYVNYY